MNYWEGKTAIVTGGASGIGAAVVQEFNSLGVNLVSMDLDGEGARSVARTCKYPDASSFSKETFPTGRPGYAVRRKPSLS